MALPNGDLVTTVFNPQMAYPLDKRMQIDTLNSRDSMSMFVRWEGMEVYVLENSTKYILQGGISNEYWKELGTGSGSGGTTFVGQFATADLLPTSGRSPGDYAFVGTGDDFVQYNWDNIAGEWVLVETQTDLASEHFYIGYKSPTRRPTIFRRDKKDVIIETSGDFVFEPPVDVAHFIFVGEVEQIRGMDTAESDREVKLTNHTGSDIELPDKDSSAPAGSRFDFDGSDYTFTNGSTITIKGNGTYWELAPNNQIAFSDHLDSVNATISVGSDGLEYINFINNTQTGKQISLKQITATDSDIDQNSIFKVNSKFFAETRFWANRQIDLADYGVVGDGVADDTLKIQKAIDTLHRFGGGTLNFPASGTFLVSHQGTKPYKSTLTGNAQSQRYCLMLKSGVVLNLPEKAVIKMADGQNAAIIINENFDYTDPRETSIGIRGNGTLDSNRQNQGTITSGGSNIAAISFQNVSGLQIGDLIFKDSRETSIKLNACDFVLGGKWHTTYSDGDAYRLGSWSPTQVFEGRIRYSNFDFLYAENCQNDVYNTIQGNPIVACIVHSSFNTIHGRFCGGGFKYQEGCEYITIKSAITEGALGADRTASNFGTNSGLKIQGGTFLSNPPKNITVGEVISTDCDGDGLYLVYCDDVTISNYIGVNNNRSALRSCVRIQSANRVKVNSINSDKSGGLGVALRNGCYDTVFDQIIVTNPGDVTPLAGIQIEGGSHRIGSAIVRDNRTVKRMTYGLDIAGAGATGNINHLITSGATVNDVRDNTNGVFSIFRKETLTSDEFKMKYLNIDQLNVGNIDASNDKLALDVRSYSNYAVRAQSYSQPAIRAESETAPSILGVGRQAPGGSFTTQSSTQPAVQGLGAGGPGGTFTSKNGRAIDVQQNENPEATQGTPTLRVQRLWTGTNNVSAALIYGNDQVTTTGSRNNPLVDLRWDNNTVFRVDNRGFIDIGNVRENRVEGATNPNLVALDRNKYLRFTGATGTITISPDTFSSDNDLIGEIEGGSKTFVAGTGVTLRYPDGQGLVAPTGSKFIIKFKSANDALVTIIKPYAAIGTNSEVQEGTSETKVSSIKQLKDNYMSFAERDISSTGTVAITPLAYSVKEEVITFTASGTVNLNGFNAAVVDGVKVFVNKTGNNLTCVDGAAVSVPFADEFIIPNNQSARFRVSSNLLLKEL